MTLDTDLSAVPYFDDYDANNNYYRVLYRPGYPVQARELNQAQSIAQDQIDKFGRHVFVEGSVVEGCTLSFDRRARYVKLLDNYTNGSIVSTTDLEGKNLVASSNLTAYVVVTTDGSEGSAPDLKTAYIKYINTGNYANGAEQKLFTANEILTVRTRAGVDYGIITVANATVSPIGASYTATVTEGVVFQKGFFIRVEPQTAVVTKYTNTPNNVSIGFQTIESVVTPEVDSSLLDPALGASNYNAPGAHRLKLEPVLVTRERDEIIESDNQTANGENFFAIADFENGVPTRIRTDPQYARLGAEMARRTFEESGNYVIDPFELSTSVRYEESGSANATHVTLNVDRGLGYVKGYRVEYLNKQGVPLRKGTDVQYVSDQTVTTGYGNYVICDEVCGLFEFEALTTVQLRSVAGDVVSSGALGTASAPGTQIGSAKIKSIMYNSGTPGTSTAQYRIYLIDIRMNSGFTFRSVRSIYAEDASVRKGFADCVLESGNAVLKETNQNKAVFLLGRDAVRNLRNDQSAPNDYVANYIYRTQKEITFATSGVATITPDTAYTGTSGEEFPYSGTLTNTSEADFVFVALNAANSSALTGTVSTTAGSNLVTGSGTSFNDSNSPNYLQPGEFVWIANSTAGQLRQVGTVTNSTSFTTNSTISNTFNNVSIYRHYPAYSLINFQRPTANIQIAGDLLTANAYVGSTLNTTMSAMVYYNLKREAAVGITKTIAKNRYVKIDCTANTTGPWSLGLPDVYQVRAVYVGTTYATSNPNRVSAFALNNGQRDTHYDLASLIKTSSITLTSSSRLLVELDHFVHNRSTGIGFASIESYPIDDANTANTTAITTQQIPIYVASDGTRYDLRNSIDFRPVANATANSATTIATATTNPFSTLTFNLAAAGAYTPAPDSNFVTDFSFYLGRIDKVALSPQGTAVVVGGIPSITPSIPKDEDNAMTLGVVTVPPYPSLSQDVARLYRRPDYSILTKIQQNRRYTMKDVGTLDSRIQRLEYYTTLSLLEASTQSLSIRDATGNDRFKNGFLVDPFNDFSIADTTNQEFLRYAPALDREQKLIRPRVRRGQIKMDYKSSLSSGVTIANGAITLQFTSNTYISQPGASKARNVAEGSLFSWEGIITLDPPSDFRPDVTTNPDIVVDIDGSSSISNASESFELIIGDHRVTATRVNTGVGGQSEYAYSFGDVIQSVGIQPYIRPQIVRFTATGLRPNTRVYPFFDDARVSNLCAPTNSSFALTGAYGSPLVTNAVGTIYGVFSIPRARFLMGDRIFRLTDVLNPVANESSITTDGSARFTAINIAFAKARVEGRTRPTEDADTGGEINVPGVITTPINSTTESGISIPASTGGPSPDTSVPTISHYIDVADRWEPVYQIVLPAGSTVVGPNVITYDEYIQEYIQSQSDGGV